MSSAFDSISQESMNRHKKQGFSFPLMLILKYKEI